MLDGRRSVCKCCRGYKLIEDLWPQGMQPTNVTQSAVGDKPGLWSTVIASVLIFD